MKSVEHWLARITFASGLLQELQHGFVINFQNQFKMTEFTFLSIENFYHMEN